MIWKESNYSQLNQDFCLLKKSYKLQNKCLNKRIRLHENKKETWKVLKLLMVPRGHISRNMQTLKRARYKASRTISLMESNWNKFSVSRENIHRNQTYNRITTNLRALKALSLWCHSKRTRTGLVRRKFKVINIYLLHQHSRWLIIKAPLPSNQVLLLCQLLYLHVQ